VLDYLLEEFAAIDLVVSAVRQFLFYFMMCIVCCFITIDGDDKDLAPVKKYRKEEDNDCSHTTLHQRVSSHRHRLSIDTVADYQMSSSVGKRI
jgi:hypothetical protein